MVKFKTLESAAEKVCNGVHFQIILALKKPAENVTETHDFVWENRKCRPSVIDREVEVGDWSG